MSRLEVLYKMRARIAGKFPRSRPSSSSPPCWSGAIIGQAADLYGVGLERHPLRQP